MMTPILRGFALACLASLLSAPLWAATWRLQPGADIQAAINRAAPGDTVEIERGSALVAQAGREARFALPAIGIPRSPALQALDRETFAQWLQRHGLQEPALLWYLDYACRDDYGAGLEAVSAWAGLHYFASRHGFAAPGDEAADVSEGVFTWPEGNAWLTRRLAAPLAERLHLRALVRRGALQSTHTYLHTPDQD